jgi:hypothetical protein
MSNNKKPKMFGIICILIGLTAPLWFKSEAKTELTSNSNGVLRNTSFVVVVTDKQVSNSGLPYCKFVVNKPIDKTYVGGCNTTNNITLKLGYKYEVTKAQVKEDTLTIFQAVEMDSEYKLEVKRIYYKAGTRIAVLSNGQKVIGNNLYIGSKVSIGRE